jgi:hypothetical protein
MVQALDAAHAQDIARPSSPVEGCQQCRVSYSTASTATNG